MAASVSAVATAIATRLATISGLRTFAFQPDQINPPIAFPVLEEVTYHNAFGGGDVQMDWTVVLIAGRYTERTSYAVLDAYLSFSGATSLRATLESDTTLGGVVSASVVSSGAKIGSVTQSDAEFLSVEFAFTTHS